MQNNKIVGTAFENAVGQVFGQRKNAREFNSVERTAGVILDFVKPLKVLSVSDEGIRLIDIYPSGIFIEAKTSKTIDLNGSTPNQIKAMIDACSNQISINSNISGDYGVATMFLVTLDDSKISSEVINYAMKKHVLLYQFKALYDKDNPSEIKLSIGRLLTIPTNRDVIPDSTKSETGTGHLDF